MVTIDDVLNGINLTKAFDAVIKRERAQSEDSEELKEYWELNAADICEMIREGTYEPQRVKQFEILRPDGRRRIVSDYAPVDRIILRAMEQVLRIELEALFHENLYSYRHGKGYLQAVKRAADYLEEGYRWVAEMDIAHYFDNIDLGRLMELLSPYVDSTVYGLIHKYLFCTVEYDYEVRNIDFGLIQGNSIGPLLSNLFLTYYDWNVVGDYHFVRFSDNINVYTKSRDEALTAFRLTREYLESVGLKLRQEKSGVFEGITRRFLGHQFNRNPRNHKVTASRYKERKYEVHRNWHGTAIQKVGKNYHLLSNGILSRQDFNVLFENEEGKHILPVEVIESINIYSTVSFSTGFFEFANKKKLRVNFFDKFGECIGHFYSQAGSGNAITMLKQADLYNNNSRRLAVAKKIEIAAAHNIRANIRYYRKHSEEIAYEKAIEFFTDIMEKMKEAKSIDELMLLEARSRQTYYELFRLIIPNPEFELKIRTRRPPKDPINAMISFGNVFLYNRIATEVGKTSLDIRVGIIHATNRRQESLNLDIAEIFKPLIVDRVIFSLINKGMIDAKEHFIPTEGGMYLNQEGKRLLILEMETKLRTSIKVKEKMYTYDSLIAEEIRKLKHMVEHGSEYRPFKYQ